MHIISIQPMSCAISICSCDEPARLKSTSSLVPWVEGCKPNLARNMRMMLMESSVMFRIFGCPLQCGKTLPCARTFTLEVPTLMNDNSRRQTLTERTKKMFSQNTQGRITPTSHPRQAEKDFSRLPPIEGRLQNPKFLFSAVQTWKYSLMHLTSSKR
jgi:hypothetical protein